MVRRKKKVNMKMENLMENKLVGIKVAKNIMKNNTKKINQ